MKVRKIRWEDIIFHGHNKHYGAYMIRKKYPMSLLKATFVTILSTLLILTFPLIKDLLFPHEDLIEAPTEEKAYNELTAPPAIEKRVFLKAEHLKAPPKEKIVKNVPPKQTNKPIPPEKKEDIPKQDEIDNSSTGDEAQEGDSENHGGRTNVLPPEPPKVDPNQIFERGETDKPAYPIGGFKKLYEFLGKTVRYPGSALRQEIGGKVMVQFVVEKNGEISNVSIMDSVHPDLDNEAVRAVKRLPKWNPAIVNGSPVRFRFQIPITFNFKSA